MKQRRRELFAHGISGSAWARPGRKMRAQSRTKTEVGEAVAVRLRDTLDNPVQAKPPELVSGSAQERCERLAEVSVGEAPLATPGNTSKALQRACT